jgi:tetratricopeptide (TPR) repeat protein
MGEIKKAEQDYLAYYQHTFKENYSTYYEVLAFYERHLMYQELIAFANNVPIDSYPIDMGHAIKSMVGRAYSMTKQYDKALEIYDKLVKEMPDIAEYNFIVSELNMHQGLIDEAEAHLTNALKIMPNYVYALYNMSLVQSQKKNKEDFIIYLDRALESDKSNQTKDKVATEPEFKKYYTEEAFQRILYKYNIRLKTEG